MTRVTRVETPAGGPAAGKSKLGPVYSHPIYEE